MSSSTDGTVPSTSSSTPDPRTTVWAIRPRRAGRRCRVLPLVSWSPGQTEWTWHENTGLILNGRSHAGTLAAVERMLREMDPPAGVCFWLEPPPGLPRVACYVGGPDDPDPPPGGSVRAWLEDPRSWRWLDFSDAPCNVIQPEAASHTLVLPGPRTTSPLVLQVADPPPRPELLTPKTVAVVEPGDVARWEALRDGLWHDHILPDGARVSNTGSREAALEVGGGPPTAGGPAVVPVVRRGHPGGIRPAPGALAPPAATVAAAPPRGGVGRTGVPTRGGVRAPGPQAVQRVRGRAAGTPVRRRDRGRGRAGDARRLHGGGARHTVLRGGVAGL